MELQEKTSKVALMIRKVINACINDKWKFSGGQSELLALQADLSSLTPIWKAESVDDNRIVDYIIYQLYRSRTSVCGGRYWCVHFMFTDYAKNKYISQFQTRDGKSGIKYYIELWLSEHGFSYASLVKMIAVRPCSPNKQMVYMESDEGMKKRFFNTDSGYLLCQRNTTGWAPLSVTCQKCKYQSTCEMETEKRFPELVRYRRMNK